MLLAPVAPQLTAMVTMMLVRDSEWPRHTARSMPSRSSRTFGGMSPGCSLQHSPATWGQVGQVGAKKQQGSRLGW